MITGKHWLTLERVIENRQLTTLTTMITEIRYYNWGKFYQAFYGRFAMCEKYFYDYFYFANPKTFQNKKTSTLWEQTGFKNLTLPCKTETCIASNHIS